ncbi:MAG: hypothetical protein ACON5B_10560 [Myxococcota bacterium]
MRRHLVWGMLCVGACEPLPGAADADAWSVVQAPLVPAAPLSVALPGLPLAEDVVALAPVAPTEVTPRPEPEPEAEPSTAVATDAPANEAPVTQPVSDLDPFSLAAAGGDDPFRPSSELPELIPMPDEPPLEEQASTLALPAGEPWMDEAETAGTEVEHSLMVVSTIPHTQPPRAVVALDDEVELVVVAGMMLPDLGAVVTHVGEDTVELTFFDVDEARATPRVEVLSAAYPRVVDEVTEPSPAPVPRESEELTLEEQVMKRFEPIPIELSPAP